MKTCFDRFMETFGRYEQLCSECRYDKADKLCKKLCKMLLKEFMTLDRSREDDCQAISDFDEFQRYKSNREELIREYARYKAECNSIEIDKIITDLYIVYNIDTYKKAELKSIKDDWKGFLKNYIDQDIDPISFYKIRYRIKTLSDVFNNMDVKNRR